MGFSLGGAFGDVLGVVDPFGLKAQTDEINQIEKKKLQGVLGKLDQAGFETKLGYGRATRAAGRTIPLLQKAYGDARGNLGAIAGRAAQRVSANEPARIAQAHMGVGAGGWGNSNLVALADRGVRGDTTRALQQLDDLFAQQFGDLAIGEANALGGVNSQIAGLEASRGNNLAQILQSAAEALGSVSKKAQPSIADNLAPVAQILGAISGGGGGGLF